MELEGVMKEVIVSEGESIDELQLGAMENPEECVVAELKQESVDEEDILQTMPQQYIIIAPQDADGNIEPASKYIRIEGEDGQHYLLAIAGDASAITGLAEAGLGSDQGENVTVESVETDQEATSPGPAVSQKPSTSGTKRASTSSSGGATDGVNQTWFTTRDDKHAYQKGGHSWKQGQWTKEEIEILQNNIQQYCDEHQVGDAREIIFEMSKDERKDFYRTVARGLQRPLFSVYRRVTRMYDQKNHMGKYTADEMNTLRELRSKFGNDWAAIGTAMGRSASSVKDKCRLMKDNCNSGKWYPEEEHRLAQAIYDLTGTKPSESITQGLSWAQVAERVGTRSEKQCRTKWLNYLNWKQQGGADWTRQDDFTLIEKISKLDVQNDQDIDWNELAKDWPSVRSPQWLRGKWWSLKRHVPDYQELEFREMLANLLSMQYQNTKLKNGMRMTQVQLSGMDMSSGSVGEMALQIPVSLQTPGVDGSDDLDFQAFEVLQQWTPNNSTAFFITQPQLTTSSASSGDSGPGGGVTNLGDHIIVHAMPIGQGDHMENVQVQLNPQVIIQAGNHEGVTGLDHGGLTIQLSDGLHHEQDLHVLSEDGAMTEDDSLQGEENIPEQGLIQVVRDDGGLSGGVVMEAVVCSGDLMGCGSVSSPPQYTQSSNDAEIIDPLSDPILASNETDLMGNSSDLESEKVHHHGLEVDLH